MLVKERLIKEVTMRNFLFVCVIVCFSAFSFNAGQVFAEGEGTTSGITADDAQAQDSIEQLSAALDAARQELDKSGLFSFSGIAAFKKILNLQKKLQEAILNDAPASRCNAVYDSTVNRLDNSISFLEKKGCMLSQRMLNRGKCAKFLNDPLKFQQCEAQEHGTKPSKPHKPKTPSCISQETLDSVIPDLQSASESLKSLGLKDDDTDGVPNFCENNSQ